MDVATIAALIASATSLVVAVVSYLLSERTQRRAIKSSEQLVVLQDRLNELAREGDARRAYTYEARKRLYSEVEPLLFQLRRAAAAALDRVQGLAQSAAAGQIGESEKSWLRPGAYYTNSTLYRTLAPLAITEMIRRKLTYVDLTLDPLLTREYELAEAIASAFQLDFDLAEAPPTLHYDPDDTESGHGTERGLDAVHRRQGVYSGWLEQAVDSMVEQSGSGARLLSSSDFDRLINDVSLDTGFSLRRLDYLFVYFHPTLAPVLWRSLLLSAHFYIAIIEIRQGGSESDPVMTAPIRMLSEAERATMTWSEPDDSLVAVVDFLRTKYSDLVSPSS